MATPLKNTALLLTAGASLLVASCSSSSDTNLAFLSVTQNRTLDTTGQTVDVAMAIPVSPASANSTASWTVSAGNILSATLQPDARTVRLIMDAPAIPGDVTFGAAAGGVEDLAGNSFSAPVVGQVLVADILTVPSASFSGVTVEGADNDQVVAVFNDSMIQAEVETLGNWTLEAPVGTPFDLTNAVISYDTGTLTATVSLGSTVPGIAGSDANNLQTSDALQLTFGGIRNLSGVSEAGTAIAGTAAGDNTAPTFDSVWADGASDEAQVRFSEPVKSVLFAELYSGGIDPGVRFQLTDADATPAVAATGTITITGDPVDGETMVIADGAGNTDTYEWESGGGVGGGNIAVTITGGDNNAMATALQVAIAGSGTAAVTAVDAAPAVTLTNDVASAAGNVAITGTPTNVTIAGMSGGVTLASGLATLETTNFIFSADQTGVTVDYDIVPVPGSDTLEIYGIQDLAGNQAIPVQTAIIAAADVNPPAIDAGNSSLLAVSGENNDVITVRFDRDMSPFNISNPANYSAAPLNLAGSSITFNGTNEIAIDMNGATIPDVQFGTGYSLTIVQNVSTPLYTAQGVMLGSDDVQVIAATGDNVVINTASAYVGPAGAPNTCIIVFPEATNATGSTVLTNYNILGTNPTAVVQLTPRSYELTFPTQPAIADSLVVEIAASTDLGGNPAAGQANYALTAIDATAPTATFTSNSVAGFGLDHFDVTFDEPMDQTTAMNPSNYAFTVGGSLVSLDGASVSYDSTTFTVSISLRQVINLNFGDATNLVISNVTDISGVALAVQPVDGTVIGDNAGPNFAAADSAFVNYIVDATGATNDVIFDEAVDVTFAETAGNWTTSDATNVVSATMINPTTVRVVLDAQIGAAATLGVTDVPDLAGNAGGGAITVDPAE